MERETFPGLIDAGAVVMGYPDGAYWLDVGTPEAFVQGSCDLVLGRLPSPALASMPGVPGEALLLDGARVAPGARVGGGSVVGAGAADRGRGAGRRAVSCSTGSGSARAPGSAARVVGHRARIGESVVLDGAVLGDDVRVASGNELRAGMRVWPGVDLGPTSVRFSTDA